MNGPDKTGEADSPRPDGEAEAERVCAICGGDIPEGRAIESLVSLGGGKREVRQFHSWCLSGGAIID